jgi:hypothetical protein
MADSCLDVVKETERDEIVAKAVKEINKGIPDKILKDVRIEQGGSIIRTKVYRIIMNDSSSFTSSHINQSFFLLA